MGMGQQIKKEEALDNFRRGQIYGFIVANPGAHYHLMVDKLGLNNGTLGHHLIMLERKGYISSRKDGIYRRFYPVRETKSRIKTKYEHMLEKIFGIIQDNPGICRKEVAERSGVNNAHVAPYLNDLKQMGSIESERTGRRINYYTTSI